MVTNLRVLSDTDVKAHNPRSRARPRLYRRGLKAPAIINCKMEVYDRKHILAYWKTRLMSLNGSNREDAIAFINYLEHKLRYRNQKYVHYNVQAFL